MARVLNENYKLGSMTPDQQEKALQSENQVQFYRTKDLQNQVVQEFIEGTAAQQLREDFKTKIEMQNCTIKQPLNSGGDIFLDDRKKSASIGQFLYDHGKMKSTFSAKDFTQLNFRDQMQDHKKTNFNLGHQSTIIMENSSSHHSRQLPLNGGTQTANSQNLKSFMEKTANNTADNSFSKTTPSLRPLTASSQRPDNYLNRTMMTTAAQRIKHEHSQSKVLFGNDRSAHKVQTDYRNNFMWTIPKYAM